MRQAVRNAVLGLAAVILTSSVAAAQSTWTRYYVGGTALSLESPLALGAGVVTPINDPKDWVAKITEYVVETKLYFLQIAIFEGKPGQVADQKKLASTMADYVSTIADNAYTTKFTASADGQSGKVDFVPIEGKKTNATFMMDSFHVGHLDGQPVFRVDLERSDDHGKTVIRIALVGEGNTVHLVNGVGFPVAPEGLRTIDRMMKSVRFQKGL